MAMKRILTKADYDKLPDAIKFEYKQVAGKDEYALDIEGYEDPGELRRALDRVRQENTDNKSAAQKALDELKELKQQLEDTGTLTAKKKGDIEALEKSWQAKLDAAKGEGTAKATKLETALRKALADGTAAQIAAKISNAPAVLMPHIRARLDVDFSGDEPKLTVLGQDGKPSALTVEELSNEYVANSVFSSIIIGSKASGGGADGGKQGGGGAPKKFAEMNDAERTEFQQRDPAGFEKASKAASAGSVKI